MIADCYPNDPEVIARWEFPRTIAAHDLLDAVEAARADARKAAEEAHRAHLDGARERSRR